MKPADEMLATVEEGVQRALKAGADQAEVLLAEGRGVQLASRGGHATPVESHGLSMSVRVAVGDKLGVAGAAGSHMLETLIEDALDRASGAPAQSSFQRFAEPREIPLDPTPIAPEIGDPERLDTLAQEAMEGLASDETTYETCQVESSKHRFAIANSNGLSAWDQGCSERFQIEVRLSRGSQDLTAVDAAGSKGPLEDAIDARELARDLVERGREALEPEPLEEEISSVVLAPGPGGQLVHQLVEGLAGTTVQDGRSIYAGKLGDQIVSEAVTIEDRPNGPGVPQRCRIDHEGLPTGPLPLVVNGILESYLHNSISGRDNGGSNGRARRSRGWLGNTVIGPIHVTMAPGTGTLEDLLAEADRAVYVPDPFSGTFTSNPTTGDFSLVAPYAFLVEEGEIVQALPHTTVGGNVQEMLASVTRVGGRPRTLPWGTYPAFHAEGGVSCAN